MSGLDEFQVQDIMKHRSEGEIVNPHVFPHVAEPLPKIGDLTERCGICRKPKGEHWIYGAGRYQCPVVTFFTPCKHPRRRGIGMIGTAGSGGTDETCDDCGTRIVTGCYAVDG